MQELTYRQIAILYENYVILEEEKIRLLANVITPAINVGTNGSGSDIEGFLSKFNSSASADSENNSEELELMFKNWD